MQEIVADLTYKMFNGDQQAINDFVRAEPNLAQRILEKIKEFIQTLTGNTQAPNEMQKRLQKAQELFEQALESRTQEKGQEQNGDLRYMLVGKSSDGTSIYTTNFPAGLTANDLITETKDLWQNILSKKPLEIDIVDEAGNKRHIIAQFDPDYAPGIRNTDLGEMIDVRSKKNTRGIQRRATLELGPDLYDMSKDMTQRYEELDDGHRTTDTHKGIKLFRTLATDITYKDARDGQEYPMTMWLKLKENGQGQDWTYFYEARKRDKPLPPRIKKGAPTNQTVNVTVQSTGSPVGQIIAQTQQPSQASSSNNSQKLSLPATDNQYLQAIESNDLDTAQQLVDQAAFGSTQMTSALAESTDENVRTLLSALTSVAPRLAQLRSGVQEGTRYDVGINDIIAQAAEKYRQLRRAGTSVNEYLEQPSFEGMDPTSDAAKLLLPVFEKYNRSAVKLSAILDGIVSTVESYGDPNQQMLDGLGSMIPTAQGIIASSIRNTEQAMADRAAGIAPGQMRFDAETVHTEAAEDAERWLAAEHPDATREEREDLRRQFMDRYEQMERQRFNERNAALDVEWRAQNEQRARNYAKQLEAKFPGLKVVFTDLGGPNGKYDKGSGTVYIDLQHAGQTDIFNRVLFHELTHHIEATGQYQQFQDLMLSMAFHTTYKQMLDNMKAGTMTQADQELLASIQSKMYQYNSSGIADAHLDQDGAVQEIVADLTYKMFNGDQQAINDFVRAEPNLAQRILEKIKEFIQTLTGNTQEPNEMQKRLQKAQELFEQALRNQETQVEGRVQYDITGQDLIEVDDTRREQLLRQETLQIVPAESAPNTLTEDEAKQLTEQGRSQAEKSLISILGRFDAFKSYVNSRIDIEFEFSRGKAKESAHYQTKYRHKLIELVEMYANLDAIIKNAKPVETHTDIYDDTSREDNRLERVYVLLSIYQKGSSIIPVEIEVKQFKGSEPNSLHSTVTLNEIRTEDLGAVQNSAKADELGNPTTVLEFNIADIVSKINPENGFFLKYIPDGMLNEEQIKSKRKAIQEENEKKAKLREKKRQDLIKRGKVEEAYEHAVRHEDTEAAQRLVDQAAKDAGYNLHVYHGTGAQFNEFSYDFLGKNGSAEGQGFYFTDSKEMASGYASGEQGQILDGYLRMEKTLSDSEKTLTRKQLRDILKAVDPTCEDVCINYEQTGGAGYPGAAWKARALNDAVSAIFEGNDTDSDILAEIANSGAGTEEVTKAARQLGFDGYKVEGKYPGATVYVAFESDQFKRGDAVTYDDAGNVIPLSQRFNPKSKDIRYSLPTDQHQSGQTALPIDSQLQQEIDAAVQRALAEREAKRAQNLDADVRRSAEDAMRRVETYEKRKGLKAPSAERAATYLFDDTLPLFKITERLMDQQKQRIEALQQKQKNGETLTAEEKAVIKRGVQGYDSSLDPRDLMLAKRNVVPNYLRTCVDGYMVDAHGERVMNEETGQYYGSLADITKNRVKQSEEQDFMLYVMDLYGMERLRAGHPLFEGDTMEDLAAHVADAQAMHPGWREAADELSNWYGKFVQTWSIDSGAAGMRQSTFDNFRRMYPHYLPAFRAVDQSLVPIALQQKDANGNITADRLSRLGAMGAETIRNPMVSLVTQMQQYMETAKQAEAMQAFDGFFSTQDGEATGWAELINEVPAKEDDGTITPGIMEAGSHFTWVSQDEEGNRIRTAPCKRSSPT